MSTLKTNAAQVGQSVTATNNFTWYQPATPDGTVRLGRGNAGSVTDILSVTSSALGVGNTPFQYNQSGNLGAEVSVQSSASTNSALSVQSGLSRFFVGTRYNDNRLMIGANGASFPTGESPLMINTSGHVTKPMQPMFKVYATSNTNWTSAIASQGTVLTNIETVAYNVGNNWNPATRRFTAPVSGYYFMCAYAWALAGNSTECGIAIRKNGSVWVALGRDPGGSGGSGNSGYASLNPVTIAYLASGDYIEVVAETLASTATIHTSSGLGYSEFSAALIN